MPACLADHFGNMFIWPHAHILMSSHTLHAQSRTRTGIPLDCHINYVR